MKWNEVLIEECVKFVVFIIIVLEIVNINFIIIYIFILRCL